MTFKRKWLWGAPVVGAVGLGVGADRLLTAAADKGDLKPATGLPVTKVVLFSSGVGYFGRSGEVEGDARVDLRFPEADVNDLLKSLTLQDLGGANVKKIAVGKVATVPVGRYTKQVLDGANLWTSLEPKFVQADSVRQVLDYVARGEVEAGFVYRTDAAIMSNKVAIALPAPGHAPVRYPVAVIADSRQKALAQAFIDYLLSPAGQQIVARYGFATP